MRCQDDLAHDVFRIDWTVYLHRQVPNQSSHGRQSLGMNTVFRLFDTYQTRGFRIFGQYRQRQKSQGAIRNRIRRELLAIHFSHRESQKFTNVVPYDIDDGHRHKLRKPRRNSRDGAAVRIFLLLQPIQCGGKMRSIVGYDSRISSEAIGSTHGARFERKQPPLLHLSACGEYCRSRNRIGRAYDRSRRRASRGSLTGASRPTVLMHDNLCCPVRPLLRRDIAGSGEPSISNRLVPEFRFLVGKSKLLACVSLPNVMQGLRAKLHVEY